MGDAHVLVKDLESRAENCYRRGIELRFATILFNFDVSLNTLKILQHGSKMHGVLALPAYTLTGIPFLVASMSIRSPPFLQRYQLR